MLETSRLVMQPKHKRDKYDIALVIPCYNEGVDVLDTIYTAVVEAQKVKSNIAVFLIVNNAYSESEEVIQTNKKTAKLVISLIRKRKRETKKNNTEKSTYKKNTFTIKKVLSDIIGRDIEGFNYNQRSKINSIIESKVPIGLIDCFTPKNAPEICNVGYARNIGTNSILDSLKGESSVISHSDADCKMLDGYFQSIEHEYFENNIDISTGYINFAFDDDRGHLEDQIGWIDKLEAYLNFIVKGGIQDGWEKEEDFHFTPGSHMQFTKKVFMENGGFDERPGAEDVLFGMKAVKNDYTIQKISSTIETLSRFSDRTEAGHGFGFEIIRKGKGKRSQVKIITPEYIEREYDIIKKLEICHQNDNFSQDIYNSDLGLPFSRETLDIINNLYIEYKKNGVKNHIMHEMPYLLSVVRIELFKICPRKPVFVIMNEINDIICNDIDVKNMVHELGCIYLNEMSIDIKAPKLKKYCEISMCKLETYIALKQAYIFQTQFVGKSSLIGEKQLNIKGYPSMIGLNKDIYHFLKYYCSRIIQNFQINIGGITRSEINKIFQIRENEDNKIIELLEKIDLAIYGLNEDSEEEFLSIPDSFNINEFFREI